MLKVFIPPGEVRTWSVAEAAALRLRNSEHATILRIPGEILVPIFRQVIKASSNYEETVRFITSICYYLRTLVFDTPELWGFVNMRGSLGPLFLQRCQGNPISVVPYFVGGDSGGNARMHACLNYWKNMPDLHLTRVELIEFCGTHEDFAAVSWIFNYHIPNLETLTLASGKLVTGIVDLDEDPEVWNVNLNTQRTLTSVHLQHIFVPWESNIFYGLSTLYLDYRGFIPGANSIPMDAFLDVLSHSPHLEKCTLSSAIPQYYNNEMFQDSTQIRIVELPLLGELTLFDKPFNVGYLLRFLSFPATTKTLLKVDVPPDQLDGLVSILFPPNSSVDTTSRIAFQHDTVTQFCPALEIGNTTVQYLDEWAGTIDPNTITQATFVLPLLEAAYRAGPFVRLLKIRLDSGLVVQPAVWKVILERLPNLEEIVYMPGEDVDCQWPAFWSLLRQTGENGLVCPSLRILRIVNEQGVPPDVMGCLAVRWNLGRPLEVFQLRAGNCDPLLAHQTITCLTPYVGRLIFEVMN